MSYDWGPVVNDPECKGCTHYRPITGKQMACHYIFDVGRPIILEENPECNKRRKARETTMATTWNTEEARERILAGESIVSVAKSMGITDASIHGYRKAHPEWLRRPETAAGPVEVTQLDAGEAVKRIDELTAEVERLRKLAAEKAAQLAEREKEYMAMGTELNQKTRELEKVNADRQLWADGAKNAQERLDAAEEKQRETQNLVFDWSRKAKEVSSELEMERGRAQQWEARAKHYEKLLEEREQSAGGLEQEKMVKELQLQLEHYVEMAERAEEQLDEWQDRIRAAKLAEDILSGIETPTAMERAVLIVLRSWKA